MMALLWIWLAVCAWGFMNQRNRQARDRDRQHRELLAGLRKH
jgi:hypothetical protein